MKRITVILAATLMISLAMATASPKSDGYFGKTKVDAEITIKAIPFDLKDVTLLDSPFATAMEINKEYMLKLDADRFLLLWPAKITSRIVSALACDGLPSPLWFLDHVKTQSHHSRFRARRPHRGTLRLTCQSRARPH